MKNGKYKFTFYNILLLLISNLSIMNSQQIDIQGHRGCRGLFPENTLLAFEHALTYNFVTTLELDVVISKDNQVVISHEPYMNSLFTTKPNGQVVTKEEEKLLNLYQMDYATIKTYDVGIRGNKNFPEQQKKETYKPLLSELFELVKAYESQNPNRKINFNIEIKSEPSEYGISQPKVAKFSDLVYNEFEKYGLWERITLQSFDFEVLKYWQQNIKKGLYQKVLLAALVEKKAPKTTFKQLGFVPDIFSPYYKILTKEQIDFCHKKNSKVIPWTINDTETMQQLVNMGVNGIITDYPNRAQNLTKRQ